MMTFGSFFFFLSAWRRPASSTLFPYTTLFRSDHAAARGAGHRLRTQVFLDLGHLGLHLLKLLEQMQAKMAKIDRKSTRLNSSHANISYAVFCLKKKKIR